MTDDKTRAKAMTKAVQFKGKKTFSQNKLTTQMLDLTLWFIGVSAVEIKGDHRNQIEVTGTEVDMICLTKMLRKKVAFAELVSVSKVEPPKKPEEEKKPAPCKPCPPPCKPCPPPPCNPCPPPPCKPCPPPPCNPCPPPPCNPCPPPPCKPCPPPPCKPCPPPPCNPCPPPPCYPSPQGYGVPSAFPYPCNPYSYIGEPVYNHEPSCTIL
ncbi:unnamed protein product [Brassica oleracea var. botrytis]|uniref:HMA domain-containing protein n=1 Tax=Brassica oleracea TaxID=3712 RepID=A0A3P6EVG1_BRAOL|nr:unnamed protein product [Brassica oleracea]